MRPPTAYTDPQVVSSAAILVTSETFLPKYALGGIPSCSSAALCCASVAGPQTAAAELVAAAQIWNIKTAELQIEVDNGFQRCCCCCYHGP